MTFADLSNMVFLLAVGALIVLLPGYALRQTFIFVSGKPNFTLFAPDGPLGALLDSLGLSLAVWPLLLLYGSIVGVSFTAMTIWLVLIASGIISVALFVWRLALTPRRGSRLNWIAVLRGPALAFWPLLALSVLAITLRFIAVHYLFVPLWGDSLHHTLITQLFLDQQRVPTTYEPYAPAYSFTYHFGFHALSAVWAWLTGQTSWSAVISMGQILNALAVPAAYMLTRELFRDRLSALFSAVAIGFLSGMPTYYVNWGRYTQLAGQILLPFVICWFLRAVEKRPNARTRREQIALFLPAIFGAVGLGLTHYRILIFFALFVIAYLLIRMAALLLRRASGLRTGLSNPLAGGSIIWGQSWQDLLRRSAVVALFGGILFLPWLGNLLSNYLPGLFQRLGQVTASYLADYNAGGFLLQYVGAALPALAALGFAVLLAWGPARTRVMTLTVALWALLLVISTKPALIGLPGSGAMNTFTVGIAYYLPFGALAGPALGRLVEGLLLRLRAKSSRSRVRPTTRLFGWALKLSPLLPILLAVFLIATNPGARTIEQANAFMTPDDAQAMEWIKAATPQNALFLISAKQAYANTAIVSTDAGMWIPLLTGRQVSVPPLSVGSEGKEASDLVSRTKALFAAAVNPPDAQNHAQLKSLGVNYIYIGEQEPGIPADQQAQHQVDKAAYIANIQAHPQWFQQVYKQGAVYIFALK